MTLSPGDTFTCFICHEVTVATVSTADAQKEFEESFPEALGAPTELVCDPCWQEFNRKENSF